MIFSLSNIFSLIYNLTINRLTNEQRLQIIEFYYQNVSSVKKVHRVLLPFILRAIVIVFRAKITLLDIKSPTRLRIAAVSAGVNDDHQLLIRSNWASVPLQRGKFCGRI